MTTENFDKRPNYFAGQYLLEEDFELEQKYHIDRQRRHNRLLHVSGIADGLIVTPGSDALTVQISAGTAIDKNGQQIVWSDSDDMAKTPVKLKNINNAITSGKYILLIEFDEKLTTLQGTTDGYTRWYEKPNFSLVLDGQTLSEDFIALAKLNINDKTVTIDDSDKNIRQYSGLRLPSTDQINAPTLRSGGDNASNLAVLRGSLSVTGNLSVSSTGNSSFAGNLGIGTTSPSEKLEVSGNIKATGLFVGNVVIGTPTLKGKLQIVNSCGGVEGSTLVLGEMGASNLRLGYHGNYSWIQSHGDKPLAINPSGSNSNVGIGTTNPTEKLEISGGNLKVSGNISATNAALNGNIGIGTSKDKIAKYLDVTSEVGTDTNLVVSSKSPNLTQNNSLAPLESVLTLVRDGVSGKSWTNIVDFRIGRYENSDNASRTQLDILLAHRDLQETNEPTKLKQVMTLRSNGNVGIGTSNPSKGLVEINGMVTYDTKTAGLKELAVLTLEGTEGIVRKAVPGARPYSLYANGNIAATEFNAVSDSRIKELKGRSNSQADLQTLLKLAITDYTFKDKIAHGDRQYKKVVGQQIAQVYPQSVRTHKDAVPDVFQVASTEGEWVSLPNHGLQVGERVKLIWEGKEASNHTIKAVTLDKFQVSINHSGEVFVYGREVDDFHVVDYEALSMLHISATQEIYKIITGLQAEIQQLKSRLNENDRHHSDNVFSMM